MVQIAMLVPARNSTYNDYLSRFQIRISTQLISCLVAPDWHCTVGLNEKLRLIPQNTQGDGTARSFLITLTKIQGDRQMSRCNPDTGNQHFPSDPDWVMTRELLHFVVQKCHLEINLIIILRVGIRLQSINDTWVFHLIKTGIIRNSCMKCSGYLIIIISYAR